MKHALILILLSICMVGCSVDEISPISKPASQSGMNKSRTPEEILGIASKAALFFEENSSRNCIARTIDERCGILSIGNVFSRGDSSPLMHVVNFEDNRGFVIVSDNKDAPEIIAVTEDGHFTSEEELDNPGISIFCVKQQVI